MRLHLPWNKKEDDPVQLEEDRERLQEAATAVEVAKGAVADARARGPEVQRLVKRMKQMQQENHIGERVEQALREGYSGGQSGH
jgi:hypothetical protein